VRYLLDAHPCMRLAAPPARLGGPGLAAPADGGALRGAATACYTGRAAAKAQGRQQQHTGGSGGAEPRGGAADARGGDGGEQQPASCADERAPGGPPYGVKADLPPGGRWLSAEEAALVQRFDPCGPLDTIGFFAARFEKAPWTDAA
jgi:hypothetical protein